ncbi:MAG: peptidoglycan-binding domain-containing protein [Pseudomonadota bacterium]
MSKGMNDRAAIGGEWLFAFAGVGLASALVTVFLLTDPYWKLATIGTPVDETTTAVAELFEHDDQSFDDDEKIEFAFADILLEPDPRRIARQGPAEPHWPQIIDDTVAMAPLDSFTRRAGPRAVIQQSRFETAVALAQTQAPRGYSIEELETMLELSAGERRMVQLRLALAGHNPKGVDGVFGPATRAAILAFQTELGVPATGYLDAPLKAILETDTEQAYAQWRRERDAARFANAIPEPRPERELASNTRCVRDQTGEVIAYQGILCDLTGLGESLLRLDFANNVPRRFADGPKIER